MVRVKALQGLSQHDSKGRGKHSNHLPDDNRAGSHLPRKQAHSFDRAPERDQPLWQGVHHAQLCLRLCCTAAEARLRIFP